MTARAKKTIAAIEKEQRDFQERFARKANSLSREEHWKILKDAGIITADGKLAPRYARTAKNPGT